MKSVKKAIIAALCAGTLVVGSVAGTMAYLTDQTAVVQNTFTVGKVGITLDEAAVDAYGVMVRDDDGNLVDRVTTNSYKLMPGHEYIKDPKIHVASNSEDSWLFVKVENGIADIEADTKIAAQMTQNGWSLVANETNVYAYSEKVSANENINVFGSFKLSGDANVSAYENAAINITAYAVQADGFANAAAAWVAALASWTAAVAN